MIELKYFFPGQEDCTVNLGIQESHYKGVGVGICNYRHGVKWIFNDNEIKLFEENVRIISYPSPDMKYVVAVYYGYSKLYSVPNNCVVYNLDGSIHKIISTPILKVPDEKGNFNKGYAFTSLGWTKNKDNKLVMYLYVLEEKPGWVDWYEEMEFDAESGEFGELLSRSGR